jgi:hypothetical protein
MDNGRAAEWILSLALPPDRAAGALGDLLEDAGERGNIWFWSCVFRTLVSRIWSDLTERPGHMATLALRGCIVGAFLTGAAVLLWFVAMTPFFFISAALAGLKISLPATVREISWGLASVMGLAAESWGAFQTGRWIARRAPAGKWLPAWGCACYNRWFSILWAWLLRRWPHYSM